MTGQFKSALEIAEEMRKRIVYGYTQTDLAKDIGVSKAIICEVLKGTKLPCAKSRKFMGYSETPFYQKRKVDA